MKAVREKPKRGVKPATSSPSQPDHPAPLAAPPIWRKHALLIAALWTVALIAYSNSFSGGFVFDNSILMQDTRIKAVTPQNIDLILTQEYWYNWSLTGLYRPLTTFSYLFNYSILGNGTQPAGYHWINFGLHAVNIGLVYALALLLLGEIAPAFALAAIWSLHPLLTESVTNIVGRSDLLAAFGVLGVLLCHIMAASAVGWRKLAWLLGLALVALIGLFSKESTVVVVAALVIYDLIYHGLKFWRARAPGYLALALPICFFFFVRYQVLSKIPAEQIAHSDNPLFGIDFWTARLTAIKVIGKYLWLLVWPNPLSCDYSYNQIPLVTWRFGWEDMKAWIALAACLGAGAAAVWCYRRQKAVLFFVAFFFFTLSPTSNLVIQIGTIMAERFMYLPSIGFAGCLVVAVYAICRRLPVAVHDPRIAPAVLAVICIALLARTFARNNDWLDEKTLWTSAVEASPDSFKTHMALSTAIAAGGTEAGVDRAIGEIERSLAILAPLPDAWKPSTPYINAGLYYRQKGDLVKLKIADPKAAAQQALYWYQKSLEPLLKGKAIEAALNVEARRRAEWHAGKVLDFGWWQLDMELGRTYQRLSDPGKAVETFRAGLRRRPLPQFYVEMAAVWRELGEYRKAAVALMEGLLIDPTYTEFTSGPRRSLQADGPEELCRPPGGRLDQRESRVSHRARGCLCRRPQRGGVLFGSE